MKRPAVALVDEPRCIGCVRCIHACPVDAIAGAQGYLHTVIEELCTGCALCVPACPVDCIAMVPPRGEWTGADAAEGKRRSAARKARLRREGAPSAPVDRKAVIAGILAARKTKPAS